MKGGSLMRYRPDIHPNRRTTKPSRLPMLEQNIQTGGSLDQSQRSTGLSQAEQANYVDDKRQVLRFKSHVEVFHLSKLLVPRVQIGIQILDCVGLQGHLTPDDIKVRMYVCQLRLNVIGVRAWWGGCSPSPPPPCFGNCEIFRAKRSRLGQ